MNPWLGARRGHLTDWTTQQWVRRTGRRVDLRSAAFDPAAVDPRIAEFYERTGHFRLHLWSEWSPLHRPFGVLIDRIFARRLGQLRLPLAPLETSRGVASELVAMRAGDGRTLTAWVRRRLPEGDVIYAGFFRPSSPRSPRDRA